MKNKIKVYYIIILVLLVLTFFFKIIPIPLENLEGYLDKDSFIYGGIYWTSGLYESNLDNYTLIIPYFVFFALLILIPKLVK